MALATKTLIYKVLYRRHPFRLYRKGPLIITCFLCAFPRFTLDVNDDVDHSTEHRFLPQQIGGILLQHCHWCGLLLFLLQPQRRRYSLANYCLLQPHAGRERGVAWNVVPISKSRVVVQSTDTGCCCSLFLHRYLYSSVIHK